MDTNPPIDAFQRLRPTCVKLSKKPTRLCIQELHESLELVDALHLVKLTEYVLFPLQLTLQRSGLSNELKQDAVSCIEALIRKTRVEKLNVFNDLFSVLTTLLSDKEPGKVAHVSEELKLNIINCLNCLLETSGLVIRSVLYRAKFLPSLGHAVSLLLDVVENDKARELKIASLMCLRRISFCDRDTDSSIGSLACIYKNDTTSHCSDLDATLYNDEPDKHEMYLNIRDSASLTMASFLPGISMALSRVISGDPAHGHVVLTMAIDIWGDVVSLVMNDSCLPELDSNDDDDDIMATICSLAKLQTCDSKMEKQVDNDNDNPPESMNERAKTKDLNVYRTREWFSSTGMKLKVLIEKLTSTASCHSNWKVRLSLINFCETVLMNCSESLSGSISLLVDVLVGALEDEYTQVSMRSKAILDLLSKDHPKRRASFKAILEENLHSQLTVLPRLMRRADDVNKQRALNLLNGYMTLLSDKICVILSSSSHLKRLSLAFIQVLEFDVSDVGIVEERTPEKHESAVIPSDTQGKNPMSVHTDEVQATQYPRYRFKHFTGDKIRAALSRSCQLLGYHGDLPLLVDHFLDLFHESKVHQKQAVFILNEIIIGFSSKEKNCNMNSEPVGDQELSESLTELTCAVKLLLSAYTSEKTWNLPTSSSTSTDIKPSYQNLNSNILLSCLLLEGIGVFAHSLGACFAPFLIETLYLVLSKLGDGNAAVSRSAYGTLVLISQNCGYLSVEDLITRNADYLVNSIALDLKYVFVNEQAPHVLKVMIQYSNQDILVIIEDTLNDIFNIMDLYPDQLIHALIKVLYTLAFSLQEWFAAEQDADQILQNEQQFEGEEGFSRRVTSFLQNYIKSKRIALGEVEDVDLNEDPKTEEVDDEDLYKPDVKPEVPLHVKYATQVLEKCIHFLSSSCAALRVLVLDTVYCGVRALKQYENDLLPMIHRLWPPIVNRLTDKDQVVIIRVIHVITTMAECSGDFMKRRVIKDVLPKLLSLLEKQAGISLKASAGCTHSQAFKLQHASLEGLGRLCKQLDISEQHLDDVTRVCCSYLSSRQPMDLQKTAVAAFEKFIQVDPDAMWLVLNNVYCPQLPKPPHHMFVQVQLAGTKPECKEFASNVSFLLDKLHIDIH